MICSVNALGTRLRGKAIFLSASVPIAKRGERYPRVDGAHFEIEQAVISLARAVFSEAGQLVFRGHPAISPLVAMVAGEYREPRTAESGEERPSSPIRIFQSRAFEGYFPTDTLLMYRLGYATITWTDAVEHERFDPTIEYEESPCPKSLRAMREAMIVRTKPEAMVCIGGMDGVEKEAELFRELRPVVPVYVLERTGGASLLLARTRDDLRVIDTEIIRGIEHLKTDIARTSPDRVFLADASHSVAPYPLIMQTIVDEISRGGRRM